MVLISKASKALKDFEQIGGRIMKAEFAAEHNPICIFNVYAPQSHRPVEEKGNFYDKLSEELNKVNDEKVKIVVGDFNARIQGRRAGEEDVIGAEVFGRGNEYLEEYNINQEMLDNRQRFIEFCQVNNLCIMNTMFKKPPKKTCTFRDIGMSGFEAPFTPERYAEMDFITIVKPWKTGIKKR